MSFIDKVCFGSIRGGTPVHSLIRRDDAKHTFELWIRRGLVLVLSVSA